MADTAQLRPGRAEDVAVVAAMHHTGLPDSFLTLLGAPFLQVLYRRIVASPGSLLVVADLDGQVVGFVAGTEDTGLLYRDFVRRDGLKAGAVAAPRAVRHARRVVETLTYSRRATTGETPLPPAELLSLVVAGSARERGVGAALVRHLQADLRARGVDAVRVVVAADNASAVRLYRSCDFSDAGLIQVHRGQPSRVLTWQ